MSMRLIMNGLIVSLMVGLACSSYDFRSEDRPVYRQTVSPAEAESLSSKGAVVLDVRLREDFDADPVLIPQARYLDPDRMMQWARTMTPSDGPVVVYCMRGKWVSQKAATYLKERGFEVYSLEGGIEAWKEAGRPTTPARE